MTITEDDVQKHLEVAGELTAEQVKYFMEKLGFVEAWLAGERVYAADVGASIRVNGMKRYNSVAALKTEIYKRVAYHRDEFLKNLDKILLFCLSDLTAFDKQTTKERKKSYLTAGQQPIGLITE